MKKLSVYLTLLLLSFSRLQALTVHSIFGDFEENDPLVEELLDSPIMERLKGVQQSGITYYLGQSPSFSRYDHSIGVYHLLKKFKVNYKECIAGLIHDTSHTVFSHLGDFIYPQTNINDAYQDQIIDWWLIEQNLERLLQKHDLTLQDVSPKNHHFSTLDNDVPNLCADRIEYLCHTALVFNLMDNEDVKKVIGHLQLEGDTWFFTSPISAKKLAYLSLYFTEHFWGTSWNYAVNHFFAEAVRKAVDYGEVTFDDVHFSMDERVLEKIKHSPHETVRKNFNKARFAHLLMEKQESETTNDYDFSVKVKFRGVDPLVKVDNKLLRLSQIDKPFKEYFEKIKDWCLQKHKFKMHAPENYLDEVALSI